MDLHQLFDINIIDRDKFINLLSFKPDINIQDDNGNTILMKSLYLNDLFYLKLLLRIENIDINIKNNNGDNVLSVALKENMDYKIIKLFIQHYLGDYNMDFHGNKIFINMSDTKLIYESFLSSITYYVYKFYNKDKSNNLDEVDSISKEITNIILLKQTETIPWVNEFIEELNDYFNLLLK